MTFRRIVEDGCNRGRIKKNNIEVMCYSIKDDYKELPMR